MKHKSGGKLILTKYNNPNSHKDSTSHSVACFLCDNRLEYIKVIPETQNIPTGTILTGQVKNIVSNIQAAFVALDKEQHIGFLSLERIQNAIVTNRPFRGKLQQGDEVLVQVLREPMKTKDATLTTALSITGKYAVVQMGSGKLLFSKKLSSVKKEAITAFLASKAIITREKALIGMDMFDITIRTEAGKLCNIIDLAKEIDELTSALKQIITQASTRTCYSVHMKSAGWLSEVWSELSACGFEIEEYVTDDITLLQELKELVCGEDLSNIRFYQDSKLSLHTLYGLNSKIEELRQKKVWLPCGGYLCIEPTEAMIVIDVNSGKAIEKGKDSESLFLQLNKEAAFEIVRQLRLRNLSGMILVDFVNMKQKESEAEILSLMKMLSKSDFSKVTVYDFTRLGILEMTRDKKSRALHECL